MAAPRSAAAGIRRLSPLTNLRVWHLVVLVVYVAVAIQQMQAQRIGDPLLIGLASFGFVGYGILGWVGWCLARSYADRHGRLQATVIYMIAMACLFLLATIIYLLLEYAHLVRYF